MTIARIEQADDQAEAAYQLGLEQDNRWAGYLKQMAAAGESR